MEVSPSTITMMRPRTQTCKPKLLATLSALCVACLVFFSLETTKPQTYEAQAAEQQLQGVPAVKGLGIIAAAAAAAAIPKLLSRRNRMVRAGKKKGTSGIKPTPSIDPALAQNLQGRVGKLVNVKFPTSKDVIICRLLKTHTIGANNYAILSIENGKMGTEVACNTVRDMAMKMAAANLVQAFQKEKQRIGQEIEMNLNEIMYIKQQAILHSRRAISNGTLEGVQSMVGPNASVITVDASLVSFPELKDLEYFEAVMKGDKMKVDAILASGMEADKIDDSGRSALYFSCREGHVELAKHLISKGCQVDRMAANGATPLFVATQSKRTEIMRSLIEAGADVKRKQNVSYAFLAAQNGQLESLNLLLDHGADPAAPSMNGFSCLYIAAQNGHAGVVKRLLEIPDMKSAVNEGMPARQMATPALIAAQMNHMDVLKVLVESGANIKQPMTEGTTPIKVAAAQGDPEVLQFLIDNGADVNSPNKDGYTALMAAAVKGNVRAVELLLRNGANVDAKTKEGQDALGIAKNAMKQEVVSILTKATGTQ
mmetsp:Transcript_23420/g.37704  ORF Transcript_23420/g.37704 Transcript_23420/m.37704 type:complete len:541 (+) Transcript_23420:1-1623(+)